MGIYDVRIPPTNAYYSNYKNIAPNVSAIDLHNLIAVTRAYSLARLANSNLNVLSINLDNLQTLSGNYAA